MLRANGFLLDTSERPGQRSPSDDDIVMAMHAALAASPARLIAASFYDVLGELRQPNMPGTTDQYPNWRMPLPASLEEIRDRRSNPGRSPDCWPPADHGPGARRSGPARSRQNWRTRRLRSAGMRLATWNVNSVTARLPRLLEWLDGTSPDVVCLQETKTSDFPVREVGDLGYQVAALGSGRWNGVALLSRVGLDDVTEGFDGQPGFPDPEARAIGATCGGVRVWSVYVPNGRTVDDPHYTYKLEWLAALRDGAGADGRHRCAVRRVR